MAAAPKIIVVGGGLAGLSAVIKIAGPSPRRTAPQYWPAALEVGHRLVTQQRCPQAIEATADPNCPSRSADEVQFVIVTSGLCGRIPPTNRQRMIKKA